MITYSKLSSLHSLHLLCAQWCKALGSTLQWRHNGHDGVSIHQPHHCLLNRLFRPISKKTLKVRVTGLCVGNSPRTGEFPAQMTSNAENVSIWWHHHDFAKNSWAHKQNFIKYIETSNPIRSQFCTCHNNSTVLASRKLWPSWIITLTEKKKLIMNS